jgi:hypothetical protein
VVGALGGIGSRILALRKSEPTLEEVFVELVGRGFDDDADQGNGDHRIGQQPPGATPETAHVSGEPEPEDVG